MRFSLLTIALLSAMAYGNTPAAVTTDATSGNPADNGDIERLTISYRQAYRGDVPASALPQAITVLDGRLLTEAGISGLQDALDLSASFARQNNSGGLWDSFSLRGFPGNENMPSGYLINGFSGGRGFSGPRDTASIDYIEVLKGPGSALYGRSEPGGAVNIITKKPQMTPAGYVKAELGSESLQRLEADVTGGLSDNLAGRMIAVWQDADSFRDEVYSRRRVLTPSVRWQLSGGDSLLYEFEYVELEQLFDRGIVVLNGDFNTVPRSRYLGEPGDGPMQIDATGHQLTYEHFLPADWVMTAGLSYRRSSLAGFSSDAELSASRQSLFVDGTTLTRQHRYRDWRADDTSVRVEFSGKANTAGIEHHLLLGLDGYQYHLQTAQYRYRGALGSYSINIFDPVYYVDAPEVSLFYDNRETQQSMGAYLQDQLDLSRHWKLLLGVRLDYLDQTIHERATDVRSNLYDHQLSPRAGLVYQLNEQWSFYGSYSEGFLPLSNTDYAGRPFGAEQSQSVEIGSKFSGAAISGTVALFSAKKTNILVADPVHVGFSAALGAATSQGLELDLQGQLGDALQLLFSYALLDSKTDKDAVNADWGVAIPKGSPLVNVPKHNITAVLRQELADYGVPLQLGLRYRFVDDRLGDAADLSFRLPAYQLYGLFANWQASDDLSLSLSVDNLLDKHYIDSSYNALWAYPGEPRNIKVSASYAF